MAPDPVGRDRGGIVAVGPGDGRDETLKLGVRLESRGFQARRDEFDLSVGRQDEKGQARRDRRHEAGEVAIVGRRADEQDVDLVLAHAPAEPLEAVLQGPPGVLRHRALLSSAVAGSSTVVVSGSIATP